MVQVHPGPLAKLPRQKAVRAFHLCVTVRGAALWSTQVNTVPGRRHSGNGAEDRGPSWKAAASGRRRGVSEVQRQVLSYLQGPRPQAALAGVQDPRGG